MEEQPTASVATLAGVTLDCPSPRLLAEFYQHIGGGEIVYSSATFVYLIVDGFGLGFQLAPEYQAPSWPDPATPQQAHVDFRTTELDRAESAALAAGAQSSSHQPKPEVWRVLFDPAGHPFCFSTYGTSIGPDAQK